MKILIGPYDFTHIQKMFHVSLLAWSRAGELRTELTIVPCLEGPFPVYLCDPRPGTWQRPMNFGGWWFLRQEPVGDTEP